MSDSCHIHPWARREPSEPCPVCDNQMAMRSALRPDDGTLTEATAQRCPPAGHPRRRTPMEPTEKTCRTCGNLRPTKKTCSGFVAQCGVPEDPHSFRDQLLLGDLDEPCRFQHVEAGPAQWCPRTRIADIGTTEEAAEILGVTTRTAAKMCREERLQSKMIRAGGKRGFNVWLVDLVECRIRAAVVAAEKEKGR